MTQKLHISNLLQSCCSRHQTVLTSHPTFAPATSPHFHQQPVTPTFLCHAVHHRAKHQDISAAVCASSEPTVTAQTCRANRRQTKPILIHGHSSTRHSETTAETGCAERHTHIAPGTAGEGEGTATPLTPLSKTAHGKRAKLYGVHVPRLPFMQGRSDTAMALWAVEDSPACNP